MRHLKRLYGPCRMTENDPNRPFKSEAANVRFWIAERTLLARRSLYAAVTSSLVGLLELSGRSDSPLWMSGNTDNLTFD
jgi:hypothetical protein